VNSLLRRSGAAAATAALLLLALPLPAATAAPTPQQLAPGAAADAYGIDVDVTLLPANVPVDQGPISRASQEYPPLAAGPQHNAVLDVAPIPSTGDALVKAGIVTADATATGVPFAQAKAVVEDVELLSQSGTPLITAESLVAMSTTDCTSAPSAAGTDFVNLRLAGVTDPIPTPAPNTEVGAAVFNPLGVRIILNEQHPTADGRGLVVNAIHIYDVSGSILPTLFRGDLVVSHAMSTVNCPNGAPSTGGQNAVVITKTADKPTARHGDTVTYTATVQNKSTDACLVNKLVDHMPVAFDLVSTSGAFGTNGTSVARPGGGGSDVVIKPTGVTIPAGGSATQTYVLKVRDDAEAGVYFNNVELFCGNLGNWVKGLDAPVEVVTTTEPTPMPPVKPPAPPECSDKADNDGDHLVDYPDDPGCPTPLDDDEVDDTHPRTGTEQTTLWTAGALLLAAAYGARRRALR
jgi:uncharacterized repeat protein (TIGR01451 family)